MKMFGSFFLRSRHCEERSDAANQHSVRFSDLPRCARNDDIGNLWIEQSYFYCTSHTKSRLSRFKFPPNFPSKCSSLFAITQPIRFAKAQ